MLVTVPVNCCFNCRVQKFDDKDEQQRSKKKCHLNDRTTEPDCQRCHDECQRQFLAKCSLVLPGARKALRRKARCANDSANAGVVGFAQLAACRAEAKYNSITLLLHQSSPVFLPYWIRPSGPIPLFRC